MNRSVNIVCKYIILFFIGGSIYYSIELLWRSYSHISMFILGGIVFLYCGIQNEYIKWETPLYKQVLMCLLFTLIGELVTGLIVNVWLNLNVWDYSDLPLNLFGQICLPFALIFIPLCLFGIVLDDYIRYYLFNEEKPYYRLI